MKIGLFGINFGIAGDVDAMVAIAQAAEAAGLESLWTGEHVVLPDPQVPPSPSHPQTPFLDPAVALSHIAAHTSRIRLGTGVIILPQRNPVVLAKELASVDVVSKGRLIFGLGAGYLEPEFRALGAPFEERGDVTDEAINAIKALWTMEKPSFKGRFFSFSGIDAQPRPRDVTIWQDTDDCHFRERKSRPHGGLRPRSVAEGYSHEVRASRFANNRACADKKLPACRHSWGKDAN